MEKLNINSILDRDEKSNTIKDILKSFEANKNNMLIKKGIYVYGTPGTGKTTFVSNILKEMGYDKRQIHYELYG